MIDCEVTPNGWRPALLRMMLRDRAPLPTIKGLEFPPGQPNSSAGGKMTGMPHVTSVNVGDVEQLPHGRGTVATAIRKHPVEGAVAIGPEGLDGDRQADRRHHGGPDKAALLFSLERYPTLRHVIGHDLAVPSFGENLTVSGACEADTCIGDTLRIGTAIVQVTQPRNPCFKQAALHRVKNLVIEIERTGCTGWYVRVRQPGSLRAGDDLILLDRPHPLATVELINRVIHSPVQDAFDLDRIADLLRIPTLGASLRDRLDHLAHNIVEDPQRRRLGS